MLKRSWKVEVKNDFTTYLKHICNLECSDLHCLIKYFPNSASAWMISPGSSAPSCEYWWVITLYTAMEISFCQDILFYILLHLDFHSISSGGEKWPSYPSHSSSNQKKPDLNVIDIFLITAYFGDIWRRYLYLNSPSNIQKSFALSLRDVIDSRQIDKSTFSLCQLNRIEWLGIESK